jgi:hypothetical protein
MITKTTYDQAHDEGSKEKRQIKCRAYERVTTNGKKIYI